MIQRCLSFALFALLACSTPPTREGSPSTTEGPTPGSEAYAILRAMFPEVEGELSRASILAALGSSGPAMKASDDPNAKVLAALEQGRLEDAHRDLTRRLADQYVSEARLLLEDDNPRDGLTRLDRALELDAAHPEALRLHGEGSLAIGLEAGEMMFLEDALRNFRQAGKSSGDARAWLGASRAARELRRTDEAIEFARRAMEVEALESSFSVEVRQALATAQFDAYRNAKTSEDEPERVQELFDRSKLALEDVIAAAPDQSWGYMQLANLYEWESASPDAMNTLQRGLQQLPDDAGLHERLAGVALNVGGSEALYDVYTEFQKVHPDQSLGYWYPAKERFADATRSLAEGNDASVDFQRAEAGFRRCRELSAEYEESCKNWEIMCRNGVGWCLYNGEDLEGAHRAFLSMDDLIPGRGLQWQLEGELLSGVQGLAFVANASYELGQDVNSLERAAHMERASKIFDFLHEYEPDNLDWANNAGFFNRDTATLLEQRAQTLARQGDPKQANLLLARAREMMERSYLAYVDASQLMPDDVRTINDTALILIYHLQRDIDTAERYLMRAVELGEAQVPAAKAELERDNLSPEEDRERRKELEVLEVALGDAYENLGVLHLTFKGDPKSARPWFEKSLSKGGIDPRPVVDGEGGYLDQCERAEAGEIDPVVREEDRWGAPIQNNGL